MKLYVNFILSSVLEITGVPVTGTPSISLEFNFIINRRTIYGEPSINDILNRWRTCDRYTCISRTVVGPVVSSVSKNISGTNGNLKGSKLVNLSVLNYWMSP